MIAVENCKYGPSTQYKLSQDEQAAILDVNGRAISWLEGYARKVRHELRLMEKQIKLRKDLQVAYRQNCLTSQLFCELTVRRSIRDTVYCGVNVEMVYRQIEPPKAVSPFAESKEEVL